VTSPDLSFSMWCWPGPRAGAGVQQGPTGQPVLSVFLDPVNVVLTVPPFPDGPVQTARLLRELARAASRMAAELEPATDTQRSVGAHRARPDAGVPGSGRRHGD
jgi:hypothetical protein